MCNGYYVCVGEESIARPLFRKLGDPSIFLRFRGAPVIGGIWVVTDGSKHPLLFSRWNNELHPSLVKAWLYHDYISYYQEHDQFHVAVVIADTVNALAKIPRP